KRRNDHLTAPINTGLPDNLQEQLIFDRFADVIPVTVGRFTNHIVERWHGDWIPQNSAIVTSDVPGKSKIFVTINSQSHRSRSENMACIFVHHLDALMDRKPLFVSNR